MQQAHTGSSPLSTRISAIVFSNSALESTRRWRSTAFARITLFTIRMQSSAAKGIVMRKSSSRNRSEGYCPTQSGRLYSTTYSSTTLATKTRSKNQRIHPWKMMVNNIGAQKKTSNTGPLEP